MQLKNQGIACTSLLKNFVVNDIKKLAIIAGKGSLPHHIYQACLRKGIDCTVIGLEDHISLDLFSTIPHRVLPMHAVSKILNIIHSSYITHVVLAGSVKRSSMTKLLFDLKGAKLLAMLMKAGLNDNAMLSTIIRFLENEGLTIVSPEYIASNIVVERGPLTVLQPDDTDIADIQNGIQILKAIASFDVGQSLVIQNGLVLGIEAVEGTDELIKRCSAIQQPDEPPILIKVCKPYQDTRVDLPCIGKDTVLKLHKYNFKGVAIEAGVSLILDREEAIAEANKLSVFLYGF